MKRAALLLVVGVLLLAPVSLPAVNYYDVTGCITDEPLCTAATESATIILYSTSDCATGKGGTSDTTGLNDYGCYEFCDITWEPKPIRVKIDDCHDECYNLGPVWAGGSSCGDPTGSQQHQTKNACPISTCD